MFLIIQTTNETFIASDGGREYRDLDEASAIAIEASSQIALSEIRAGKTASSVEVVLKDLDGRTLDRLVSAISVTRLFVPDNHSPGAAP